MGVGDSWGTREELLHPRDSKGRFRSKWAMSKATVDRVMGVLGAFVPKTWTSDQEAGQYLSTVAGKKKPLPLKDFDQIQADFAENKSTPGTQAFVNAEQELPEDLILSQVVGPEAFGLRPDTLYLMEEYTGKLVANKKLTATKVGTPVPKQAGMIQLSILTPKGTRAVIPGGGSEEVFLTDEQPLRITKVDSDGQGGFYVYAVAMPKGSAGNKRTKKLGSRPPTSTDPDGDGIPGVAPQPAQAVAQAPAPGEKGAPRQEPIQSQAVGGGAPEAGSPSGPGAPTPGEAPATPGSERGEKADTPGVPAEPTGAPTPAKGEPASDGEQEVPDELAQEVQRMAAEILANRIAQKAAAPAKATPAKKAAPAKRAPLSPVDTDTADTEIRANESAKKATIRRESRNLDSPATQQRVAESKQRAAESKQRVEAGIDDDNTKAIKELTDAAGVPAPPAGNAFLRAIVGVSKSDLDAKRKSKAKIAADLRDLADSDLAGGYGDSLKRIAYYVESGVPALNVKRDGGKEGLTDAGKLPRSDLRAERGLDDALPAKKAASTGAPKGEARRGNQKEVQVGDWLPKQGYDQAGGTVARKEQNRSGTAFYDADGKVIWAGGNAGKLDYVRPDSAAPEPAKKATPRGGPEKAEKAVRDAYAEVARMPGDWVPLAELRDRLDKAGMSRDEVDEALKSLAMKPGVQLVPWDNRKALTDRDKAAALWFGGESNNNLRIEAPQKAEKAAPTPAELNDEVVLPAEIREGFEKTTISGLRQAAQAKGIKVPSKLTRKSEIIDHILAELVRQEGEDRGLVAKKAVPAAPEPATPAKKTTGRQPVDLDQLLDGMDSSEISDGIKDRYRRDLNDPKRSLPQIAKKIDEDAEQTLNRAAIMYGGRGGVGGEVPAATRREMDAGQARAEKRAASMRELAKRIREYRRPAAKGAAPAKEAAPKLDADEKAAQAAIAVLERRLGQIDPKMRDEIMADLSPKDRAEVERAVAARNLPPLPPSRSAENQAIRDQQARRAQAKKTMAAALDFDELTSTGADDDLIRERLGQKIRAAGSEAQADLKPVRDTLDRPGPLDRERLATAFRTVARRQGLTAEGKAGESTTYNPDAHRVATSTPGGIKKGDQVTVLRPGFRDKDGVVVPAEVMKVEKAAPKPAPVKVAPTPKPAPTAEDRKKKVARLVDSVAADMENDGEDATFIRAVAERYRDGQLSDEEVIDQIAEGVYGPAANGKAMNDLVNLINNLDIPTPPKGQVAKKSGAGEERFTTGLIDDNLVHRGVHLSRVKRPGRYDASPAVRHGLRPNENLAMEAYTVPDVARLLNAALRAGETPGKATDTRRGRNVDYDLQEVQRNMDSAIANSTLVRDTRLHRGVYMTQEEFDSLVVGSRMKNKGYTSTSTVPTGAIDVIMAWKAVYPALTEGKIPVLHEILAPAGTNAALGAWGVDEAVLGRGLDMDLIRVEPGDPPTLVWRIVP